MELQAFVPEKLSLALAGEDLLEIEAFLVVERAARNKVHEMKRMLDPKKVAQVLAGEPRLEAEPFQAAEEVV